MASEHHGIGTTLPGPDGHYSEEQIETFQAEDRAAARSVILLMSGVFTLGLIGASLVCRACWH